MTGSTLPDPAELSGFLRSRGWSLRDRDDKLYAWERTWRSEHVEALVPIGRELPDFRLRMEEALHNVALVEEVARQDLLDMLDRADADLVEARLPTSDSGAISLGSVSDAVPAFRDLFLAAASSASDPRINYPRRKPAEAVDFLEDVRMITPQPGSFILRAVSPTPARVTEELVPEEPFGRRVTTMLASGLLAARDAARTAMSTGDLEAFTGSVERGVSANLCRAVADLGRIGRAKEHALDIAISWAYLRPVDQAPEGRTLVSFTEAEVEHVGEAARELRDSGEEPDVELEGFVTRLKRGEKARAGEVTVTASIDGRQRPVRIMLGEEDYPRAVDAHRDRDLITLTVDLESRSGHLRGLRPRKVDVRSADDTDQAAEQPGIYE